MIVDDRIRAVHASDVATAKALIYDAVRVASERWLPPNAIGEALILEMLQYHVGSNRSAEAADYLRKLASLFDDGACPGRSH